MSNNSNIDEIMEFYGFKGIIGRIKIILFFAFNFILLFLIKYTPSSKMRCFIHRLRGVEVGDNVYIGPEVIIDEMYPSLVHIGNHVSIGMRSMIFAHSNPTSSLYLKTNYYPRTIGNVILKNGSWIAPGSIILNGVTVGENSIVGAGSVVIKDVEPLTVVAGVPAKLIKRL